ncbi:hypothetical protein DYY65_07245 [Nitrososphaera sp. AFS]|nr:hypothetical protein [Nitrososphaera sp. AFS]
MVILNYKIIVSIVNETAQYYKRDRIKKITSPAVTIYIIIKYKANVILRKLRYYIFNELFEIESWDIPKRYRAIFLLYQ